MRASALCLIPGLVLPLGARAQQVDTMRRAPGRTIIGVVTDTSDRTIDSAEVFVSSLRRTTAADSAGRFRFSDIKPGEYRVAARRLGFYPQTRDVAVTKDSGAIVRFVLVPYVRGLAPVVSSAQRGGLSGVVGDTGWAAIKGAEVTEASGTGRALSDSMGGFFLDLRPGKHFIRVKREGFASQLVSVNIPRDSGRRIMVFLKPSTQTESTLQEIALFDMAGRLARRSAAYSTLLTREDIAQGPHTELTEIAQANAGRIQDNCEAIVDGGPKKEFLWAIRASEIEAVEIYRARPVRAQVRSIRGGGRVIATPQSINAPSAGGDCGGNAVYVWLRK